MSSIRATPRAVATAALSLACGGTVVTNEDAGQWRRDAVADVTEQDEGDIFVVGDDAADSGADTGQDVHYLPPPPYGSPPIPFRRIV